MDYSNSKQIRFSRGFDTDKDSRRSEDSSYNHCNHSSTLTADICITRRENNNLKSNYRPGSNAEKHFPRKNENNYKQNNRSSWSSHKCSTREDITLKLNYHSSFNADKDFKRKEDNNLKQNRERYGNIRQLQYTENKNDNFTTENKNIRSVLDEALEKNKELVTENSSVKIKIDELKEIRTVLDESLEKNKELVHENALLKNNIDEMKKIRTLLDEALDKNKEVMAENTFLKNKINESNGKLNLKRDNMVADILAQLKRKDDRIRELENINKNLSMLCPQKHLKMTQSQRDNIFSIFKSVKNKFIDTKKDQYYPDWWKSHMIP